jgi:ABC-type ATPase with predicted acetyltransferase domain
MEGQTVSVRYRNGRQEHDIALDDYITMVRRHIDERVQV